MTPEQKKAKRAIARTYGQTPKGRAVSLVGAYRKQDHRRGRECDIDVDYMLSHIFGRPCTYCGDAEEKLGADRIDNSKGHTKNNVVPCCVTCNTSRMDNFTHEEMLVLGGAIASIKADRKVYP